MTPVAISYDENQHLFDCAWSHVSDCCSFRAIRTRSCGSGKLE
jgi:hypothetical protein